MARWTSAETWLRGRSPDDVTPQDLIVYCMYVNGAFDGCQRDFTRAIRYGVPMSRNTYTITATDRSGNRSETSVEIDNFCQIPGARPAVAPGR